MAQILSCKCGERFDLPARDERKQAPCPACGELIDVPQQGVVGLSSAKYLAAAQAKQEEALQNAPDCPDCGGKGVCAACGGSKEAKTELAGKAGFVMAILAFGVIGGMFMRRFFGGEHDAGSKYCVACNGNGRCRRCRGCGKIVV